MAEARRGGYFQPSPTIFGLRNITPSSSWHGPWRWKRLWALGAWQLKGEAPHNLLFSTESYKNK